MGTGQGIYFIPAGMDSENRYKTLDKPWNIEKIKKNVPNRIAEKLQLFYPNGQDIFIWGANDRSFHQLSQVKSGEYVIDVKNKEIVRAF